MARVVPILGWAPGYERGWMQPDLVAGPTVAALVEASVHADVHEATKDRVSAV